MQLEGLATIRDLKGDLGPGRNRAGVGCCLQVIAVSPFILLVGKLRPKGS